MEAVVNKLNENKTLTEKQFYPDGKLVYTISSGSQKLFIAYITTNEFSHHLQRRVIKNASTSIIGHFPEPGSDQIAWKDLLPHIAHILFQLQNHYRFLTLTTTLTNKDDQKIHEQKMDFVTELVPIIPDDLEMVPTWLRPYLPTTTKCTTDDNLAPADEASHKWSHAVLSDEELLSRLVGSEVLLLTTKMKAYASREDFEQELSHMYKQISDLSIKWGVNKQVAKETYIPEYNEVEKAVQNQRTFVHTCKKRLQFLVGDNKTAVLRDRRERMHRILRTISSVRGQKRDKVRTFLRRILSIFENNPQLLVSGFFHVIITGPAGSGKTTVANAIAQVWSELGIFHPSSPEPIRIKSTADFVARYTGQTAPKTRQLLEGSKEKIIFIDEAYQLPGCRLNQYDRQNEGQSNFGLEAITELVNFLDKNTGSLLVIAAGYKEEMENCFLAANKGLERRFPVRLKLDAYTHLDLALIFKVKLALHGYCLDTSEYARIKQVFQQAPFLPNQAGDVTNAAFYVAQELAVAQQKNQRDKSVLLREYLETSLKKTQPGTIINKRRRMLSQESEAHAP